jgi:hypothetical protein
MMVCLFSKKCTQAEEAKEAKRLRKRKKAEALRLLDMEKRQKQRIEEVRETERKVFFYLYDAIADSCTGLLSMQFIMILLSLSELLWYLLFSFLC